MKRLTILLFSLLMGSTLLAQQQDINIGGSPHSGTADTPREAFEKVQANFDVLFERALSVDDFGAVGDGVTDDSEAIQNAITSAGDKGIVKFTPNKTYLISKSILVGSKTLLGWGATIKRKDETKTTLASAVPVGATEITVSDPSVFGVGDAVVILDTSSLYGGSAWNENSLSSTYNNGNIITAITDNVVTLTDPIVLPSNGNLTSVGEYPVGAPVVKVFTMFSTSGQLNILGLTFDGNKANNSSLSSWYVNETIARPATGSWIAYCTFKNTPCENIMLSNNIFVTNNYAYDLNGSFVHISQPGGEPLLGNNFIVNNNLRNICQVPFDVSGHNEAAITNSANTIKTYVLGNTLNGCGEQFFGNITATVVSGETDVDVYIENNHVFNTNGLIHIGAFGGGLFTNLSVRNNHFENVGLLEIEVNTSSLPQDEGSDRISITNNTFINGYLSFSEVSGLLFEGNQCFYTDTTNQVNTSAFLIGGSASSNIRVIGNTFDDRNEVEGVMTTGIFYSTSLTKSRLRTAAGVDTDYVYGRNITIDNNHVLGFSVGIDDATPTDAGVDYSWIGFSISRNLIVMRETPSGTKKRAIRCYPGMVVSGNSIYGNSNYTRGIWAVGLLDSKAATLNGPIVKDNVVIGFNTPITVGRPINVDSNSNNIYCVNNLVTGTIADNSVGKSTVSGNTTLITEAPPLRIVRQNPEFY